MHGLGCQGRTICKFRPHRLAVLHMQRDRTALLESAPGLELTTLEQTRLELLAKIINGIHDAILVFAGIALVAFALWALAHILSIV